MRKFLLCCLPLSVTYFHVSYISFRFVSSVMNTVYVNLLSVLFFTLLVLHILRDMVVVVMVVLNFALYDYRDPSIYRRAPMMYTGRFAVGHVNHVESSAAVVGQSTTFWSTHERLVVWCVTSVAHVMCGGTISPGIY